MTPPDISQKNPLDLAENGAATADDRALVVAVIEGGEGSAESFSKLVDRHEGPVLAICRQALYDRRAEAEDLCQETFLRAFRRLGDLKDPLRFGPWLYQIARSLCRDRRRSYAAERRALVERHELERRRAAATRTSTASPVEMTQLIQSLPRLERRALELKYFEGLSYREIARRLETSFARVDHLIRQARERLKGRALRLERQEDEGALRGQLAQRSSTLPVELSEGRRRP